MKRQSQKSTNYKLSAQAKTFIKKELTRYEDKRSAILPVLYRVQKEDGWISPDTVSSLSAFMEIPEAHINEVLHFYTMFNKKPVGKYHIQICCNLTCCMFQARELLKYTCKQLKVKEGEMAKDGRFTITRVECLGSCDQAPAVQINDKYYDRINKDKMNKLLKSLK